MTVTAEASPSLALVKYWGKTDAGRNIPATSSIAIGLHDLRTTTRIRFTNERTDSVRIGGESQSLDPYLPVIEKFRPASDSSHRVEIDSSNSFPTAAGIASSSSGFAALALGLDALFEAGLSQEELSAIARVGSGSASRAVFGGFTRWGRGEASAIRLHSDDYWPELRVLVAVVNTGPKPIGSRAGMNHSRETSAIYPVWVEQSEALVSRAASALEAKDLEALGLAMRESYLMMFSTMFTARPPFIYWLPESIGIIHLAEELRDSGLPVWETMDAGPQVKLVTDASSITKVREALAASFPEVTMIESTIGGLPRVTIE